MHAFSSVANTSTLIPYLQLRFLSSCSASFPFYLPINLSHCNQDLLYQALLFYF